MSEGSAWLEDGVGEEWWERLVREDLGRGAGGCGVLRLLWLACEAAWEELVEVVEVRRSVGWKVGSLGLVC